jgi:hypothetical protein
MYEHSETHLLNASPLDSGAVALALQGDGGDEALNLGGLAVGLALLGLAGELAAVGVDIPAKTSKPMLNQAPTRTPA